MNNDPNTINQTEMQQLMEEAFPPGSAASHALVVFAVHMGLSEPMHMPNDPHQTAYNDGRRSAALSLLKLAGIQPAQLFMQPTEIKL